MIRALKNESKTRREYLHKLYANLSQRVPAISGATATKTSTNGSYNIKITKSIIDPKRFIELTSSSSYLYLPQQVIPLEQTPVEESNGLLAQATSESGKWQVRLRKGVKNDKDVFIEVWSSNTAGSGFVSSLKATEKMTKIYNDTVFGSISWSADETQIAFIGEVPEIAAYKNPFEDQPKKEEESKDESKVDKAGEEHWQDEKFLYTNDFGETLVGKKSPGVFVFNLKENTLSRLQGIPDDLYP
jgi:Acylamino-acid-releasing enzyme, N-terminal domain